MVKLLTVVLHWKIWNGFLPNIKMVSFRAFVFWVENGILISKIIFNCLISTDLKRVYTHGEIMLKTSICLQNLTI